MKTISACGFALAIVLAAGSLSPASAQNMDNPPGTGGGLSPLPPLGDPPLPNPEPVAPNPITGETVPPPGPPPSGRAADTKLPDCAPPNCGTPQIMTE